MNLVHELHDLRSNCYSIITECTLERYLEVIENSYKKNGSITGQRAKVVTKTAKNIRDRMIDDIILGAVLPPVVLGYVNEKYFYDNTDKYYKFDSDEINNIVVIIIRFQLLMECNGQLHLLKPKTN